MAQGTDFKGRSLLTKTLAADPVTNPEKAQAVQAVVLVDSQGAPVTLAGSVSEVDPAGPYTRRLDETDDGTVYIGDAVPGSPEGEAVWRISKMTSDPMTLDMAVTYAQGTPRFIHKWSERASLLFS